MSSPFDSPRTPQLSIANRETGAHSWTATIMDAFRRGAVGWSGFVCWLGVWSAHGAVNFDYDAFLQAVSVPPGFTLQVAAGDPSIQFPMFACFDDRGRLFVAESSGKDLYAGLQQLS